MKQYKKDILLLFLGTTLLSPAVHGTKYVGHTVLEKGKIQKAIVDCAIVRQSVENAYDDLQTHLQSLVRVVDGEIQKNLPYVTPAEKEGLKDIFLKNYKENPKDNPITHPIGNLLGDFKNNLNKEELKLNDPSKNVTVEDASFYLSQCGSLGSGLKGAIERQKSNPERIAAQVTDFLKTRYCPASLTSSQVKTFQKDGQMTINDTLFYASKTTSGLSGALAGMGISSAKLVKLRSYQGSSTNTMSCDYTSGKGTMSIFYEFSNLKTLKPFSDKITP